MNLEIIETGSKGNAYVLRNKDEALIIECGGNFKNLAAGINFEFDKVAGCLITHEHGDHAKNVNEVLKKAVNVYSTKGTLEALGIESNHRTKTIETLQPFFIGNFRVLAFDIKHDAAEPVGFIIQHQDIGQMVFLTDSYYTEYVFKDIDHYVIEANYSRKFMPESLMTEKRFLRNRILKSHLSLEHCIDILRVNQQYTGSIKNVLLIHLSETNSNENYFKKEVQKAIGCNVAIAKNKTRIDLTR